MRSDIRELLQNSYELFLQKAYQEQHGVPLGEDPYVTLFCDQLGWLRKTPGGCLVINMPPRHGKTLFGVVYYAAWLLGRNPRLKMIIVTYSGELAEQISYGIRRIMRTEWYGMVFSTRLEKDRQKVGNFVTNFGGSVFATSVNGVIAGIGAHYIFADDLLSLRDAIDPEKVEAVNRIFDGEITSRLDTPSEGRIAVIAHRLAENDLSAHLKNTPKTRHVVLPLVAPRRTRIQLSSGVWERQKGELLRIGSHTKAAIEKLKLNVHPPYELFYQQGVAESKLRLTDDHFPTYDPRLLLVGPILISVDTAVKEGPRNSFTAIQVWAPRDDGFYLIEQFREQSGFARCADVLRGLIKRHRPNAVLIEDRANGTALIDTIRRRISTPVVAMNPGQDSKSTRLMRHVPLIRKRPIFLPDNFLGRGLFVDEILGRSGLTDQMDAMTQMLEFVSNNQIPPKPSQPALVRGAGSLGKIIPNSADRPDDSHRGGVLLLGSRRRQWP
jgi:phage terminase large subunit-like protein